MNDWWRPTFQVTVDAFYQGELAAGLAACERLLSVETLPSNIELQTHRNLVFYAPALNEIAPATRFVPIEIPHRDGWSTFNPSIAGAGDGFRLIVRSSNYHYHGNVMSITVDDPESIVRTENSLLSLDDDLDVRDVQIIADAAFRAEPPLFPVSGFEDCRLFTHGGSWWATATVRERSASGVCQTAMLRLDGPLVTELQLLSDGSSRHEKNWMPAPSDDGAALRFVYGCSPTVVLRYADATGTVTPEIMQPAPSIARRFSGGTQVLAVDGGFLCLIHEAARFADGNRLYTHRWVWFDADWRLARLSPPFVFQERGVEFAAGLAPRGDDLIISYGVWDRDAWLAIVPLSDVLRLMAPPLDPDAVEQEPRATVATMAPPETSVPGAVLAEPAPLHDADFVSIPGATLAAGGFTPFPLVRTTIVSTTLTGNSRELIGDALRGIVDWVDWALVIDTGVTDDTLRIAREIAGAKLVVRQFPWRDDFAAARNYALAAAAELGAEWAVMLDTDERIVPGEIDLRAALTESAAEALHVKHVGETYGKERFFRLPARGRYVGPTHEAYISEGGNVTASLEGIQFDELAKSADAYRRKAERDVAILSRHTAEHPDDPRWFYYLGDSLAGLNRLDEAIAAFRVCAGLNGWDEEGAWAMYRAAECLLKLDRPVAAVEACATGMAKHAGLGELPWLAAYASWQAGRPAQAAHWARLSIVLGHFIGNGAQTPRIGFRHPPALWEGPFDVLRYALRALGDNPGADEAETLFEEAKAARTGDC